MLLSSVVHADPRIWVLIDTEHDRAEVLRGDDPLALFSNISWGRGGVAPIHTAGDATTPLGRYHITRIEHDSRFHVFIELNYPTLIHLDRAFRQGIVDLGTYQDLLDYALAHGRLPPATELGGHIGIHGVGKGDPAVHARFHWTKGCVALTDSQVDQLLEYVQVGTPVVIR
ncbi:MAG: L,D-transpeptidase [Nitrococcus sp.]|nr:L,D-transpeptidase [Nitrococcus sp.]